MLSDRADSSGSVHGTKMANSILTGNMLLKDCKGRCLSLHAAMSAIIKKEKERGPYFRNIYSLQFYKYCV